MCQKENKKKIQLYWLQLFTAVVDDFLKFSCVIFSFVIVIVVCCHLQMKIYSKLIFLIGNW